MIKTVILCAGIGRRAYPLCYNRPKCLFPIMGKPLLEYILDGLRQNYLTDLILVVGEYGEQIREYMDSQTGLNVEYAYQENPLGMGNALESAKNFLEGEEHFLVVNGDDVYDSSLLERILYEHGLKPTGLTLVGFETGSPWKFGVLDVDGNCVPRRVIEKPPKGQEPSNLAVVGVYLLSPLIFNFLGETQTSDDQFEHAYQIYMDERDAKIVLHDGFFGSFKYPWGLLSISEYLMGEHITSRDIHPSARIHETAIIDGLVRIGEDVKVYEYAVIRGPAYIGSGSVIGNHVLIRDSCLGSNCLVGKDTEIARSVVGNRVEFHDNFIGDSIIDDGCWFGAGTIAANYKLTRGPIRVKRYGVEIPTEREKLGVMTGVDVRIGTAVQISPGISIGHHTIINQGLIITEDVPPKKFVKSIVKVEDRYD